MKRLILCIAALLAFASAVSSSFAAQESDQSLGDLARRERERKQGGTAGLGSKRVANQAVGVRLLIPQRWKEREIPDPRSPQLLIDCVPEQPNSCWLMVKSQAIPRHKTTITDQDRRRWDAPKHPRYAIPTSRVASRDLRVAGYPAHEVILRTENQERVRTVYVLAHDVGRLFEFSFSAAGGPQGRFGEYAPAVEATMQSFSPLARPARELGVRAIPESVKEGAGGKGVRAIPASTREDAGGPATFELKTTAFAPGGDIPAKFTCEGSDVSPALEWADPPAGAQSFALIADDPDAPAGTWVHWVAYNLPTSLRRLPEGLPKHEEIKGGGRQGVNDFGRVGYGGPCPPPGKPHRYFFMLYALGTKLNLKGAATRIDVEEAMKSHILARAELMGRFGH